MSRTRVGVCNVRCGDFCFRLSIFFSVAYKIVFFQPVCRSFGKRTMVMVKWVLKIEIVPFFMSLSLLYLRFLRVMRRH